jgi:hypothetical protein
VASAPVARDAEALMHGRARVLTIARQRSSSLSRWNADCNPGEPMRTTLGDLVTELVDQYEAIYDDHELATVATSVTLDDILHENEERKRRPDGRRSGKRR